MATQSVTDIELADSIYELALDPKRYNFFLRLWGQYLDAILDAEPDLDAETFGKRPLAQHFRRASEILDRFKASVPAHISARAIVSRVSGPAIVLSRKGRVLASNISLPAETLDCPEALAEYLKIASQDLNDALAGPAFDKQIPLHMLPVIETNDASPLVRGYIAADVKLDDTADGSGVLVSSVTLRMDETLKAAICSTFSLSPAEADVAILLAEGLKPNEIAEERGAALNTVRTQIKKVQRKMALSGTTEIVRTLCGFAANSSNPVFAAGAPLPDWSSKLTGIRRRRVTLRDGRKISVQEQGAPDGQAILYLHGMYHGPLVTEGFSAALASNGWRLIAPSRPGFGTSDSFGPYSTIRDFLDQTFEDMRDVLDELGVETCAVMSNSFASVFAQGFAARFPERTKAAIMVSHAPFWSEDMTESLNPRFSLLAKTARVCPDASWFIRKAATALLRSGDADTFLSGFVEGIRADELAFRRPDVRDILALGAQHSLSRSDIAFSQEGRILLKDWSAEGASLSMPVYVVTGSEKYTFEHKIVEGYLEKVPQSKLVRVEGAGHYLIYTHWPAIVQLLKQVS